jgi:hypothetical protein
MRVKSRKKQIDRLYQHCLRLLTVAGLSTVLHATAIDTTAQVYNFEVAATHTYTVGHGKTVVHNDCTWFASLVNISAESVDKLKKLKVSHPDLIPKLKAALGTSGPDAEKFLADFNGNTTMLGKFASGELSVEAWDILRKAKTSFYNDILLLKKIDFLKVKGLSFNQLVTIAELKNVRAITIAENFVNKTTDLNADLADLIKNTFIANSRSELNSWSSQFGINTDLIGMLEKLSMTNKLDKPQTIVTFFNSQLTKRFDNPGYVEQLNEAIRQIDAGNTIRLEDGVDIVDVTNLKLLEYKAPNSDNIDVLKSNLKSAANQFSNFTTLPSGYSKIAKIKILNTSNPTSIMSQNDLKDYLQAYINANLTNGSSVVGNIAFLDEIQILNANGLTRFKLINNIITIL